MINQIKTHLEYLEEREREGRGDSFHEIVEAVNKYKLLAGSDEWVENFVSEYLENRHLSTIKKH